MIEIICQNCGNLFNAYPAEIRKGRKYCSKECAALGSRSKVKCVCEICQTVFFKTPSKAGKYCSFNCRDKAHSEKARIQLICEYCGENYEQTRSMVNKTTKKGHKRRFCSRICHSKSTRTRAEKEIAAKLTTKGIIYKPQEVIGEWVVDFLFEKEKKIVEIDGWYHLIPERAAKDKKRDQAIVKKGYKILRIESKMYWRNKIKIIEQIMEFIRPE